MAKRRTELLIGMGERLRVLREARGLTIRGLGDHLGITHAHVCNIEHGRVWPKAALLVRMADMFGVSLDFIVRGKAWRGPAGGRRVTECWTKT